MSDTKHTVTEEIQINAEKLKDTIQDLIHEGNVQHIVVKNPAGEQVLDIPVTIGVVGLLLAPILAAIGAIAVLAGNYTIVVTRIASPEATHAEPTAPDAPSV